MKIFRTLIQMKMKFFSSFIAQYSPEQSSRSDAYLDYLKARRYEFKAMYQAQDTINPFYNLNERNAMWYFLHSASEGYSSAQFKLGQCYLTGQLGLQSNPQKAQQWLVLAAGQGHVEAKDTLLRIAIPS